MCVRHDAEKQDEREVQRERAQVSSAVHVQEECMSVSVCVGSVSKEDGDEPLTSWAPGQDETIQL